jgi:hypothetical protein
MSANKFAPLPSSSYVAGLVTLLVGAWFVAAPAAMIAQPSFAAMNVASATPAQAVVIAPEARFTIVVEAQRLPRSAAL